jgi:hypothetical protein
MVDSNPTLKTPDMDPTPKLEAGVVTLQEPLVPVAKLTEAALCEWIATALVGQSIQYHEGYLMVDRFGSSSGRCALERHRLHAIARRMWIACELGLVHLFSKKIGSCHYKYLAVRSASTLTPAEIRKRLKRASPLPSNPLKATH